MYLFDLLLSHGPHKVLIDFSLTVKAATLIFISGRGSAISSAKQGKSGSFYMDLGQFPIQSAQILTACG